MIQEHKKFIICSLAVFVFYFYYGILQEKITRGKYSYETYDENGNKLIKNEQFSYTLSLVFIQCLTNYLIVCGVLHVHPQKEDKTSKFYYVSVSITYLLGMISSNMALRWVPYPTQVVGKSAKPIPVMILGVLLGKKSYTLKKYLFVFLIVVGMVLFMYKDKTGVNSQQEIVYFGMGELLLVLSLIMDGLTGAVQERMRAETAPTGHQMMKSANQNSAIILLVLILATGEFFTFSEFVQRHPFVLYNIMAFSLTQAVGQLFLYTMVSDFGPLPVSIITTTRKCFTVLASVIFFGNTLSVRQAIGASVVFTALFLDIFYSTKKSHKNDARAKAVR